MIEYTIVFGSDRLDMIKVVNIKLKEGWELSGPFIREVNGYFREMTRKLDKDTKEMI